MQRILVLLPLLVSFGLCAQTMQKLDGRVYRGTGNAERMEGCEGCGNRGTVRFLTGGEVDYLLPGSDIMDRRAYARKGDRITLEGGGMVMELKGDSLFILAHDYRYPYVRDRRSE